MAVSQNTEFVSTRSDIIRDAYALLNVYGASESVAAEDYEFANRLLNRMVKTWMARGYHVWLKETAFLFPQKEQSLYRISATSTDNATLTYYQTNLAADASTGATSVTVDDTSNMSVDDYIGIVLDDKSAFWTTIDALPGGNQVDFPAGVTLTGDAAEDNKVYTYTTKLPNPLNVYSGVRNDDDRDIPMNYLSYEEYFQLPNKEDTTSTPTSYNYDRQLDYAAIRLWPTPDTANIIIKLTLSRKIANFDVNSDEPDFPMEWHEAIVYNLAVRLAPAFGKNKDAGHQMLITEAAGALQSALSFDNEMGSYYIRPDFHNG
jgi:tetratricopeptide (TPR) repeat protein